MTDKKPSSNVNISADSVAAALGILTTFLGAGGNLANISAAGHGANLTASDQQNKTDVNVPELMTSLNGQTLSRSSAYQDAMNAATLAGTQQAAFYADLTRQMAIDHRDQNHTVQMLAVTPPFSLAGDVAEEANDDTDRQ
jgi:hypothetical protein